MNILRCLVDIDHTIAVFTTLNVPGKNAQLLNARLHKRLDKLSLEYEEQGKQWANGN